MAFAAAPMRVCFSHIRAIASADKRTSGVGTPSEKARRRAGLSRRALSLSSPPTLRGPFRSNGAPVRQAPSQSSPRVNLLVAIPDYLYRSGKRMKEEGLTNLITLFMSLFAGYTIVHIALTIATVLIH